MAEGQVGDEAGDDWLADLLVSNLGLEGAIRVCRLYAWDGVLKRVLALKKTNEGDTDRETLELAVAGAARALGEDHRATIALARAAMTMADADLWLARLEVKKLRRELREAIAEAVES